MTIYHEKQTSLVLFIISFFSILLAVHSSLNFLQNACPASTMLDNDKNERRFLRTRSMLSTTVINNGVIMLGVNDEGNLNVPGSIPDGHRPSERVAGLRFFRDGAWYDSTSHGCKCEGFGVSAKRPGNVSFWGGANVARGGATNLSADPITTTGPDTATTFVTVVTGPLTVQHKFEPSPGTPNLYEINVILTNTSPTETLTEIRYRRAIDWDIPPSTFAECVSVFYGQQPKDLEFVTDNGFESTNPLLEDVSNSGFLFSCPTGGAPCPVYDSGPEDHGANFQFLFKEHDGMTNLSLLPSESLEFTIFFGAAGNRAAADEALAAVGAEIASYGYPPGSLGCNEENDGSPGVYILGFRDVGGKSIASVGLSISPSDATRERPSVTRPSDTPSQHPIASPSSDPTQMSSFNPSEATSQPPLATPSGNSYQDPSHSPSDATSQKPSVSPSNNSSQKPSVDPSGALHSKHPSVIPSIDPIQNHSDGPTYASSRNPASSPGDPTQTPSVDPSDGPTQKPSSQPSNEPSQRPSLTPSDVLSQIPSFIASNDPSQKPSNDPSGAWSKKPSDAPSDATTQKPYASPSISPSQNPATIPSNGPSQKPSNGPSSTHSIELSLSPSRAPSQNPSVSPSHDPSQKPFPIPSNTRSQRPLADPALSQGPSRRPSFDPSVEPLASPSTFASPDQSVNLSYKPSLDSSNHYAPSTSTGSSCSGSPSSFPPLSTPPNGDSSQKSSSVPSFTKENGYSKSTKGTSKSNTRSQRKANGKSQCKDR